jgi:hypothetical protein
MICYKDRTFCTFYTECRTGEYCTSALTEEVKKNAAEWWVTFNNNEEVHIDVFTVKPLCFEEKED